MGNCCTTNTSFFYINFNTSEVIKQTNSSNYVYSFKQIAQNLKHPSIYASHQDQIFFTGGKVSDSLQTLCFQITLTRKSIIQYSNFEKPSYKGYSFINEDYLYYIFPKTANKAEKSFLRLNLKSNHWEDLDIDIPNKTSRQVSLKELKNPGFAYCENSLYIIGGRLPRLDLNCTTIFQLEFPSMNIYNLNVDLKQRVYKPLAFFALDKLIIILHTREKTQKLIQFDKDFKMKRTDFHADTTKFRPFTPVLKLSSGNPLIDTQDQFLLSLNKNSFDKIKKNSDKGREFGLTLKVLTQNPTKSSQNYPLELKNHFLFTESDEDFPEIPVVNLPEENKTPFNAFSSKSLRDSDAITMKLSESDKKPPKDIFLSKSLYPPENYVISNNKDRVEFVYSEEASSSPLMPMKFLFDRSGKKLSSDLLADPNEPAKDANPFTLAGSFLADGQSRPSNNCPSPSILVEEQDSDS